MALTTHSGSDAAFLVLYGFLLSLHLINVEHKFNPSPLPLFLLSNLTHSSGFSYFVKYVYVSQICNCSASHPSSLREAYLSPCLTPLVSPCSPQDSLVDYNSGYKAPSLPPQYDYSLSVANLRSLVLLRELEGFLISCNPHASNFSMVPYHLSDKGKLL